jgi:hypothetical protein
MLLLLIMMMTSITRWVVGMLMAAFLLVFLDFVSYPRTKANDGSACQGSSTQFL